MPEVNFSEIKADLQRLGIESGDTVLVHSSLKSLGPVTGGADTVIDALLAVLQPKGTLLMPSFQQGSEFYLVDRGCRFEINNTPSGCGVLTECFRRRAGVIRSLSPTHCTAGIGAGAEEILSGHENCRVSCGFGSPYHKLILADGKILLIGVTHASDTTLHFVENTNGAPTICRQEYCPVVVAADGREITVPTYPHLPGLWRDYPRVEPILLRAGVQTNGVIGMAVSRCLRAQPMAALIGAEIRRNPLFLLQPFNGI